MLEYFKGLIVEKITAQKTAAQETIAVMIAGKTAASTIVKTTQATKATAATVPVLKAAQTATAAVSNSSVETAQIMLIDTPISSTATTAGEGGEGVSALGTKPESELRSEPESGAEAGSESSVDVIFPLQVATIALASVRTLHSSSHRHDSDTVGDDSSSGSSSDDSDDESDQKSSSSQKKSDIKHKDDNSNEDDDDDNDDDNDDEDNVHGDRDEDDSDDEDDDEDNKLKIELEQKALITAGIILDRSIKECAGDIGALKKKLESLYESKEIESESFLRVIGDNISACKQAGFVNKEKLLIFVRNLIQGLCVTVGNGSVSSSLPLSPLSSHTTSTSSSGSSNGVGSGSGSNSGSGGHNHAPQFVDDKDKGLKKNQAAVSVCAPDSFIDCSSYSSSSSSGVQQTDAVKNRKNKGMYMEQLLLCVCFYCVFAIQP